MKITTNKAQLCERKNYTQKTQKQNCNWHRGSLCLNPKNPAPYGLAFYRDTNANAYFFLNLSVIWKKPC